MLHHRTRAGLGTLVVASLLGTAGIVLSAGAGAVAGAGDSLQAAVDAYLLPVVEPDLISGTVLIARDGETLMARGYGLANREYAQPNVPETKFRLGSLSKQFTAAGILVLEQQGRLSVGDSLARFYPDFPHADQITLHQLLTHTSGLRNYTARADYEEKQGLPWTIDEVIAWFADDSLAAAPGERFLYANTNYVLLAGVIEHATGQSYEEFLRSVLFEPAGMHDTGLDSHMKILPLRASGFVSFGEEILHTPYRDMPFMSGAGSLYSTALDLFRWDQALYTDAILSSASKEKMFTAHAPNYGYGWFIEERDGHRVVSHRGEINGFIVSLDRYLDDRLVVITLFNFESVFARRAIRGLCDLALGKEPSPLLLASVPMPPLETLQRLAGDYGIGEGDTLRVWLEGERLLTADPETGHTLAILPQEPPFFWIPGLKSMVRFDSNDAGAVTRLVLYNSVHAIPAPRL
ncbi:MAG: serine hydrolase domain-containing protein [Candidatus Eisenbacteria bacterium]